MNTVKIISGLFLAGLFSLTLTSCENNESIQPQQDLLPQKFSVDIPQSLSNTNSVRSGRASGRIKEDTLQGNDIYLHLNTFIAVGEGAAQLVEEFINGIRKYKIDRIQSLTYRSEDDNRIKNLVVLSDVDYEGRLWDYQLTITDAESETQPDGGKALQIFWNKGREISGIAIIKPYNCDRIQNVNAKDAVFRIDYTETSTLNYDAQMEVSISGLPLANPLQDPFSVSALKMFVGKKGDAVDVFGNTDHPNAILFTGNTGFNWAFVASGSDSKNIGVAEVGLPPSQLDETDRNVLLKEYSIRNVFTDEITAVWPGINQDLLAAYLSNTAAPGYFDAKKGFLTGGISPGAEWDELAPRITGLTPFNPKVLHELAITFK